MGMPRYHSRGCAPPQPVGTDERPPLQALNAPVVARPPKAGALLGDWATGRLGDWAESAAPRPPRPPPRPPRLPPAEFAVRTSPESRVPSPRVTESRVPSPGVTESRVPSPGFSRPDCVSYIRIMPLWL